MENKKVSIEEVQMAVITDLKKTIKELEKQAKESDEAFIQTRDNIVEKFESARSRVRELEAELKQKQEVITNYELKWLKQKNSK